MNTNYFNYKIIDNLNLSTAAAVTEVVETLKAQRIEIQIDWTNITGSSLNALVSIEQKMADGMNYTCVDTDNLQKTLNTTTGTYSFLLWQWTAQSLKVKITKNNIISGTINVALGYRP